MKSELSRPTPLERRFGLISMLLILTWSGTGAHNPGMWALEVLPVIGGLVLLLWTAKSFPLTPLLYRVLALFAVVHLIGAHYTYSQVPVGAWVQEILQLNRNPFDRFGHLMQGMVASLATRELLLRTSRLGHGRWLETLSAASALAVSACYELLEWLAWVLILLHFSQDNVLGAQGDVWDTQWDMAIGLIGAVLALVLLRNRHDRELGF